MKLQSGFTLLLLSAVFQGYPAAGCPFVSSDMATNDGSQMPANHPPIKGRDLQSQRTFRCEFEGATPEAAIASARMAIVRMVRRNQRLGPKFVRLSFHDCVGGCDGSVDIDDPNNAGLQLPIDILMPVAECYQDFLTRADIWALAGLASAEELQDDDEDAVSFVFDFYGRPSKADPFEGSGVSMPSNHVTTDELLLFFADNFGFDARETVAIMGAHTLGRLDDDNSGFEGRWVRDEHETDNEFYRILLDNNGEPDSNFIQEFHPQNGQYLWRRGNNNRFLQRRGDGRSQDRNRNNGQRGGGGGGGRGGLKMLNADMALVSNMTGFIHPTTGFATCFPNVDDRIAINAQECPEAASTRTISFQYAQNNGLWLRDFRDAMTRMVSTTMTGSNILLRAQPEILQLEIAQLESEEEEAQVSEGQQSRDDSSESESEEDSLESQGDVDAISSIVGLETSAASFRAATMSIGALLLLIACLI